MERLLRRRASLALGPGAALGGAFLAACAPASPGAGGAPPVLYVASGGDRTVTRLDAGSGRPLGPSLPVGRAPWQLATGPGGHLLLLATSPPTTLTHVGRGAGAWRARQVLVERGTDAPRLAGDGRGRAVLTYHRGAAPAGAPQGPGPGPGCRLVLLDVARGTIEGTYAPCGPHEAITSLALGSGPAGPVAYLGIWRLGPGGAAEPAPRAGRVLAFDLSSGRAEAEVPLAGVPVHLGLAPIPGGSGSAVARVYCVEGSHSGGLSELTSLLEVADRWLFRGFNSLTLAPTGDLTLPGPAGQVAFAPGGGEAYALAAAGTKLLRLDLASGSVTLLADVPRRAVSLAVTQDRIYVPNPFGSDVWAVDRHTGHFLQAIPVGRGPTGIALGP